MSHALDKDTVKRILHLHKVQGLSAAIIAQRFGYSAARIYNVIRRQAASPKNGYKNFFWPTIPSRKQQAPEAPSKKLDNVSGII